MNRAIFLLIVVTLLAGTVASQQANSPTATMAINSNYGPPFPITNVAMPRGLNSTVVINGPPDQPFLVGNAAALLVPGVLYPQGFLNLTYSQISITFNGLTNALYRTNTQGVWGANLPISQSNPLAQTRAFQGLVADPAFAPGAALTAATQVVITVGLTTQNLSPGANDSVLVNLQPYGITFPFYAQTYSSFYVAADGQICFGSGNTDFTPSPSEFRTLMPRIAMYWTDLEPQYGGTIQLQIDQSTTPAVVKVQYTNLLEWAGTGSQHTFRVEMTGSPIGNIKINQSIFNNAAQYDVLAGISPGNNLSQAGQKNLSSMITTPIFGAANEIFYEWFGLTTMPYYSAGFNNPWDLVGLTMDFTPTNPGTSQAAYYGIAYY